MKGLKSFIIWVFVLFGLNININGLENIAHSVQVAHKVIFTVDISKQQFDILHQNQALKNLNFSFNFAQNGQGKLCILENNFTKAYNIGNEQLYSMLSKNGINVKTNSNSITTVHIGPSLKDQTSNSYSAPSAQAEINLQDLLVKARTERAIDLEKYKAWSAMQTRYKIWEDANIKLKNDLVEFKQKYPENTYKTEKIYIYPKYDFESEPVCIEILRLKTEQELIEFAREIAGLNIDGLGLTDSSRKDAINLDYKGLGAYDHCATPLEFPYMTNWIYSNKTIFNFFTNFGRYADSAYIEFLKTFPCYERFILGIDQQLKTDPEFASKLHMLGYVQAINFIHQEAARIQAKNTVNQIDTTFDYVKKMFSSKNQVIVKDIVQANTHFEIMRKAVEDGKDIAGQFANLAATDGIDYSLHEFKTNNNQIISVKIIKDENIAVNPQEKVKYLGEVWDPQTKSLSLVFTKQGEFTEVSLNSTLVSQYTKTQRNLFSNPNQISTLTKTERLNLFKSVSLILDFVPIVNTIKSGTQAITGVDYITGEKLTVIQRGLAALDTMPVIGWIAKGARFIKGANKLRVIAKPNRFLSLAGKGIAKIKDTTKKVADKRIAQIIGTLVDKAKDKAAQSDIQKTAKDVVLAEKFVKQFNPQEALKLLRKRLVKADGEGIGTKLPRCEEGNRTLPGDEKTAKEFFEKLVEEAGMSDSIIARKTEDGIGELLVANKPGFGSISFRLETKSGVPGIDINIPEFKGIVEKIKFVKDFIC